MQSFLIRLVLLVIGLPMGLFELVIVFTSVFGIAGLAAGIGAFILRRL